jgi:putative phage-type endonuclease
MTATLSKPSKWAHPGARLVLPADVQQNQRELWLAERRRRLCGSDAPALLGESPYGSLYGLWLDKTGQSVDEPQNDAMRRGHWLEPHLADWFSEKTGLAVRRCGMLAARDRDHMGTNPDRFSEDGGVVEIKSTSVHSDTAKEWRNGGIARHAYIQAQQQLAVTGRSHAWFVVWIDPTPMVRGPIGRDEDLIARITARSDEFWAVNVLGGVEPEVDLATVTEEEIALRWPAEIKGSAVEARYPAHVRALLEERAELKARISGDDKRAKEIDLALRAMAGDAEALLVDGQPAVTFKSQRNTPSVDKALETDHPEIYARYVTRSSSRRIHVIKPRKAA